jgi:hypothetical protein
MVRLRAGFGVNAKSDALSFLLGIGGEPATVQDIASAIARRSGRVERQRLDMLQLVDLLFKLFERVAHEPGSS